MGKTKALCTLSCSNLKKVVQVIGCICASSFHAVVIDTGKNMCIFMSN